MTDPASNPATLAPLQAAVERWRQHCGACACLASSDYLRPEFVREIMQRQAELQDEVWLALMRAFPEVHP
jgi:hypothetical protein